MSGVLANGNGQSVSDNCPTQKGSVPLMLSRLPDEVPAWEWTARYTLDLHHAYRLVAAHVYGRGDLGRFAYAAFDHINGTYFEGKLPETLILWDLTNYGKALGWCRSAADGPPIIKLHPSLVFPVPPTALEREAYEDPAAWGYPEEWFGFCLAFDVLLHECVHASVNYLLGGWERLPGVRSYWSSHNNPLWVDEVNRIAPLLGYTGDRFTMKRPKRVVIPGEFTKRGKPKKRTRCVQEGNAPDFERFPYELPGRAQFYLAKELPFPWEANRKKRERVSPN
jgi:hypothetical protein